MHANDDTSLAARWAAIREERFSVTEAIEPLRRDKTIGSSLEAAVKLPAFTQDAELLSEVFIVSSVKRGDSLSVIKTSNHKCGRCWRYLPEVKSDGDLCGRCEDVLNG